MRKNVLVAVSLFLATLPAAGAARPDSPAAPVFALVIPNAAPIVLQNCSEIGSENAIVEVRSGGDPSETQKIPGALTVLNITCSRQLSDDKSLAVWRQIVVEASGAYRRDGSLVLYDNARHEVARWNLTNAWPSRLIVHVDQDNAVAMETVTLAVEAIVRP